MPAHLRQYSDYFAYVKASKEETVSADFDSRFADILNSEQSAAPVVRAKAIHIPFKSRLMPFLKAAAVVAVTLTVGGAALKGLMQDEELEYGQLTSGTYVQSDDVKQVAASLLGRDEFLYVVTEEKRSDLVIVNAGGE